MINIWKITFFVLVWCGFSNSFAVLNIALGLSVSLICHFIHLSKSKSKGKICFMPMLYLIGFMIIELIRSSLLVAWEVITPKQRSVPTIIEVQLACINNVQRTVLGCLVSLAPGTLAVDLNENKNLLEVHVMFGKEPEKMINFIQKTLEPKVLKVFKYENV